MPGAETRRRTGYWPRKASLFGTVMLNVAEFVVEVTGPVVVTPTGRFSSATVTGSTKPGARSNVTVYADVVPSWRPAEGAVKTTADRTVSGIVDTWASWPGDCATNAICTVWRVA